MLASLESRIMKVAAVRSRLYFFMKFLVDLKGPRPLDIWGLQESVGPPSSL